MKDVDTSKLATRKPEEGERASSAGGKNSIDMLHGSIAVKMLAFAIPLALTSILQQLMSSVDASVAGRFVSNVALAGVGGVNPLIGMFIELFVGLTIGANVLIAMRIGQGEQDRVSEAVHTAMSMSLVCGVLMLAVGIPGSSAILGLMSMPAYAYEEGLHYLQIYFVGMPFFMIYNFGSAVLRGKGDSKRPLFALGAAVLVNLALDILFASVFGWGTAGIAAATGIAYAFAAGIVVFLLVREEPPFKLNLNKLRFSGASVVTIVKIGLPAGVQGAVFAISNVVIQAAINGFGSGAIAGCAASLNFEFYTYFIANAFGQAVVTFTGQNYAAGLTKRCDRIMLVGMCYGTVLSFISGVIVTLLGETALGLFTTDAVALSFGVIRFWRVELFEFMTAFMEIPAGAMRGMGWSTLPAVLTIFGTCILRVAYVVWIFSSTGTFESLMDVYVISWLISGVAIILAYFLVRRHCYRKQAAL